MKQPELWTTERLAEKLIQDLKEMSPEEKAEVRKHLDRAFGPPQEQYLKLDRQRPDPGDG